MRVSRLLKNSQVSARQSFRVLHAPLTYIHVGEAKISEKAGDCMDAGVSVTQEAKTEFIWNK